MTLRSLTLAALLPLAVATSLRAQTLDDLAFLSGCWRAELSGGGYMEEYYSTPSTNLIVGTTRYTRGGAATSFEFTRISRGEDGIELLPYPNGSPSEHAFKLTSLDASGAVFEAPEHDFPKRIIYRVEGEGARVARIDGGEGSDSAMEWRLSAIECR